MQFGPDYKSVLLAQASAGQPVGGDEIPSGGLPSGVGGGLPPAFGGGEAAIEEPPNAGVPPTPEAVPQEQPA